MVTAQCHPGPLWPTAEDTLAMPLAKRCLETSTPSWGLSGEGVFVLSFVPSKAFLAGEWPVSVNVHRQENVREGGPDGLSQGEGCVFVVVGVGR